MAKKFMQDSCFKNTSMRNVGRNRKGKDAWGNCWILRCNFCNKFLSAKKMTSLESCYHCGKNLEPK